MEFRTVVFNLIEFKIYQEGFPKTLIHSKLNKWNLQERNAGIYLLDKLSNYYVSSG